MNESDFTKRMATNLERGMASVPLPAAEPVRARYRSAGGKVATRPATRVMVAFAAIGVALLTSFAAAAAADRSPIAVVSTAVHSIEALAGQILNLPASEPAPVAPVQQPTPGEPAGPSVTEGDGPSAAGPATVPLPGPSLGTAPQPVGTTTPSPSESPSPDTTPSPTESPSPQTTPSPTESPSPETTSGPPADPTQIQSDYSTPPVENPPANVPDSTTGSPAPEASPDPTLDPTTPS